MPARKTLARSARKPHDFPPGPSCPPLGVPVVKRECRRESGIRSRLSARAFGWRKKKPQGSLHPLPFEDKRPKRFCCSKAHAQSPAACLGCASSCEQARLASPYLASRLASISLGCCFLRQPRASTSPKSGMQSLAEKAPWMKCGKNCEADSQWHEWSGAWTLTQIEYRMLDLKT